jgi:hypothetical protein
MKSSFSCLLGGLLTATFTGLAAEPPPSGIPLSDATKAPASLRPASVGASFARRLVAPHHSGRRVRLPDGKPRPAVGADACQSCGDAVDAGYIEPAGREIHGEESWSRLPDGTYVLKIELESRNAGGLRVKFAGELPPGVVVRGYDLLGNVTEPFEPSHHCREEHTAAQGIEKTWWAPTIWGEVAGLEFHTPAMGRPPGRTPRIVKVAYLYNDQAGMGADGVSGMELSCHLDVTCFPDFANEASAVARMQWPAEETGRIKLCSGALLTRLPADYAPVFMTAAHCIHRQQDADALELFWFFQRASCNVGAVPDLNSVPRTHGAVILKLHINADWSLLGLHEPPAANYYLGWDAGNTASWASDAAATSISHPRGTHKRIAFGRKGGDSSRPFDLGTGVIPIIHVWDINLDAGNGVVEPGSSGSPILDEQRRVRGTLTGTYSVPGCPPITYHWGRLEYAWSSVKYYLENMASPTHVDRTVGGDNNNEGGNERGTASNPFNTLREATYCVRAGDDVRLATGHYNEQFKIWRPMRLIANGGLVRIGPP